MSLLITTLMYNLFALYSHNYYEEEFKDLKERIDSGLKGESVEEAKQKMCFRLALISETTNGITYIDMEDEDTGEIVADSEKHGFLVLRDRNKEETARVYEVDSRYIQPVMKYDNINIADRFYYFDGSMTMNYIARLDTLYYYLEVADAYRDEEKAYPGTITISGPRERFATEDEVLETVTLIPEEASNMEHVEKSEDYTILFIFAGNSYKPSMSNGCKANLDAPLADNDEYVLTYDNDYTFLGGRIGFYGKYRYRDSADKSYIINYYAESHFKYIWIYVVLINAIILVLAIVIGVIKAKKEYAREMYHFNIMAYQNNLIDVMAHDLRTPLMAMSGYAENLKEEANAEKKDYYVDAILKNTEHMSQIISRNLELTKIGTEDIKKNYKKIDLVNLLKESLDEYKPLFEEKKITINVNGTLEIKGDESLLKTAFDNIASNMVKYVNEGGSIDIATKGKLLTISNTTTEIVKNPSKLWEPFVRGDESRSNQGGTGLGLAIAKSIFDKHKLKSRIKVSEERFVIEIKK